MATELGRYLRKLRIDHDELLKNMADKLHMSSSMLSAIENAKRNVPKGFANTVRKLYGLDDEAQEQLEYCIALQNDQVQMGLRDLHQGDKRLAFSFARRFGELDEGQKAQIRKIINGGD